MPIDSTFMGMCDMAEKIPARQTANRKTLPQSPENGRIPQQPMLYLINDEITSIDV